MTAPSSTLKKCDVESRKFPLFFSLVAILFLVQIGFQFWRGWQIGQLQDQVADLQERLGQFESSQLRVSCIFVLNFIMQPVFC